MAETQKDALAAFSALVETWGAKYEKAVECLSKDRDALLVFCDYPAEHWKHLHTTNVIESSFARIRHRRVRSKSGDPPQDTPRRASEKKKVQSTARVD
jgi:putative transposase